MSKLVIEAETKEGFLKAIEEAKKKIITFKDDVEDFSIEGCTGNCECCENYISDEEIDMMKARVLNNGITIITLARHKELIPTSVVDAYNDSLLELQPFIDDEDDEEDEDEED